MLKNNFLDFIKIYCMSGDGGSGAVHFYRKKFFYKGGPDGGNGGIGGNIIIKGNPQIDTLIHFKKKIYNKAMNGSSGNKNNMTGSNGKDLILDVPLGTVIKDEQGKILLEIINNKENILFKGGKGGLGNGNLKNSINKTPNYAQKGILGVGGWIILELKILADIGLIGYPNSGKSTLLSLLTNAKPKISNYIFTTLIPNIGVLYYIDSNIKIVDIPGLRCIGNRFLRHVERNKILIFIIPADTNDHNNEYKILFNELKFYNKKILEKKKILVISKYDKINNNLKKSIIKNIPKDLPYIFVSSITKEGLKELKNQLYIMINES
ncbi:MAG: GTPase ObgE [Candidatus Bostrichicola ureolyticus]|nr:MAG: GTPase ObgE [Candidatus Bostrichicola ureolyticus]